MSLPEILARIEQVYRQLLWAIPARRPNPLKHLIPSELREARIGLPRPVAGDIGRTLHEGAVVATAERLLGGEWRVFEVTRTDFGADPDWFRDPSTGIRASDARYAFRIGYRTEGAVGNIKHVWEASRQQSATLLAVAWWLTRDDRFAERAADQLSSWWRANRFLQGVHWTSAYEVGLRLIAWTWIRALLSEWPGCRGLFDENDKFIQQLYFHQAYIGVFYSRGSSRNNHVMTELASLAVSAVAFPWFDSSESWAGWAYRRVAEEADLQTAADGLNREHAADYHRLVLEVLVASTMAAELADRPLPQIVYDVGARMADALAAMLDHAGRPPRYGDADDAQALLVDAHDADSYASLLGAAGTLFGPASWWPGTARIGSNLASIAATLRRQPPQRPAVPTRPTHFPEGGQSFLQGACAEGEIWLRCDHAPLGYLSIAAHGHADALSFELRIGTQPIFVDPGTYCYHGEAEWRRYFKGTIAHNTVMVDGRDQAEYGGPFLWKTKTTPKLETFAAEEGADRWVWQASHDGYRRLKDPVVHHRRIELDRRTGGIAIIDWLDAGEPHDIGMHFHLAPEVEVILGDHIAELTWPAASGRAVLELPEHLIWTRHRGETSPPLGWMSRRFGQREPTTTLVGRGRLAPGVELRSHFSMGGGR